MLMVMPMMVIGLMIGHKVLVLIIMWMALNMKVNGMRINNMERVQKSGQMVLAIMVHM